MSGSAHTPLRRLMMTSFGWNDSGGGTTVPRLAAKELARRGWDVTVFHAAVPTIPGAPPYEVREWEDDGVRLIGVHNRPHGLFDLGNPERELDDPPITAAFESALDRLEPDVIHFHNLHNLGAALFDRAANRGIPSYFTTHNYWLVCPRVYLLTGTGSICQGPGDGSACAGCVGGGAPADYARRLAGIRGRAQRSLRAILAVSDSVRETLLASGYSPDLVDVVRQAMPHETEVWEQVGRHRAPRRLGSELTVAFLGSAYPHKGPQLLVDAAQRTAARIRVKILGEVPQRFAHTLRSLDRRDAVEITGAFKPSEIGGLLREVDAVVLPSLWWDCAPLAAAECLAARTPLVVPRLGGLPEAIRDDVDGLTFDGLDADDLARQLDRLALEPGLLERLQSAIEPPRAFGDYVDELERYYAGDRPGMVSEGSASAPAVRWQGDHGLPTSLSIINDQVTARLDSPVQRVERDGRALDPPLPHAATVEVRHQWPPDLRPPRSGRLAVIQPWEFGAAPREWISQLQRSADELWVPSEFVRQMYIGSGLDPARVVSIPNGVDLDVFGPAEQHGHDGVRFLFVGGLIWRKGADVLLEAWREAFPNRTDVTLVIKDFGADGVYRNSDRGPVREHAASGRLPRIELIDGDLSTEELVAIYRSCDVLVHPYRGEGFGMPVLEAMACGLPVIVTSGGPTDEFCPPEAGWRIRSRRASFPGPRVDTLDTVGIPWVLEPDEDHLIALLNEAAANPDERRRRGAAARAAAQRLSWDRVAAHYRERLSELASRTPLQAAGSRAEPFALSEEVTTRVLATPAWRGSDRLGELLLAWASVTTRATRACLYLLADPKVDGDPAALESRVLAAAARTGADIEGCADINVLMEPFRAELDPSLHAAVDAYVPLHRACAGHERLARASGNAVLDPDTEALRRLLGDSDRALSEAA
jgi:glycosyltransferase involved in cell wall biosynthesis